MDEGRDSESESGSDVEEYSGMEQPPLIKQLKTILAEYPDDGQIIKELVQNAEDAGATEMKILFDGRRLNTDTTKKLPYGKFFKAPALCFYNNAVFSDKDWKGIRMIYSSVKEEDPLKVGRFGLGFKSVFHITDNPCIISGDRILLMNPHDKNPGLVCTTIKLKRLTECKRLEVEEFLHAFSDTFGFSEDCLNTGVYKGTIFWFPLRESASKLSGTCYDGNKVLDLFKSFQSEAVHSLLFLKSLCKAELFCRGSDSEYDLVNGEAFFSLEVGDGHDTSVVDSNLYRERTRFLEEVKTACGQIPSEDIVSVTHPTFRSRYKTTHSSSIEERSTTWVVVNVFKGGTMSNRLRQLVSDKELSYKPYVGAAVPLMKDNMEEEPLKGHIFCFLPLPPEKKSLTGLPVHFNGFFALSQNRRHVKWATDDQEKLNMHLDKSIEWNELLVNEMLPGVYMRLVQELIKVCKDKGNVPDHVAAVYRCIPDGSIVDSKWEGCMNEMFKQLIMNEFIFVSKLSKWVQPNQPLYTMFDRQNISEDQKETVKKLLKVHKNVENTDVPSHIWKLLQRQACPRDVSPAEVCEVIRSEDVYKGAIDTNEKLHLLQYLTKDGKFGLLEGLELLPLQNGSFTTFQSIGDSPSIFCCNKEEIALFPGLEEKFVSNNLPQKLQEITNNLGKAGKYQLRILAVDDMISLLQDTILKNVGDSEPSPLTITTDKRLDVWLENVWMYIFNHFAHVLTRFSHLPLIPCLTSGNWNDSSVANLEIMLFNMFHTFLLKSFTDVEELPDKICDALERMSVKILPSLPKWLDVGRLQCIFTPNTHSIVRMFEQLSKHPEAANMFNSTCTAVDAEALIDLIEKKISTLPASNAMVFLQRLDIFKHKDSTSDIKTTLTSVTVCDRILSHGVNIPVRFVRPTLISDSYICMSAAKKLGANVLNEDDIVSEVLQEMKDTNSYSIDEVYTFMLWILDNIHRFQDKSNLMSLIRNVCFVDNGEDKLKPSELYDPRDSSLLALFYNERKFPVNEFATDAHLNALLLLGLRTKQNLTADCLYMTAKHLDQLCRNGQSRASLEPKAKMLLQTFGERTDLLSSTVRFTCSKLHMSVRQFLCIPHKKERPHGYPEGLGWKGSEFTLCAASELKYIAFSEASGSVIPLVKCNSETVGQIFSWTSRPEAFVLTEQLRNLVANYRSTNKAGILQLITSVYRAMMERTADMTSCREFQNLLTGKCIWWGDEFCSPGQIVLERRSEDIDVRPYMYTLPSELELMKSFFIAVGCHQKQTIPVLLEVLQLIREKHRKHYTMNEHEVGKDLQLVLQILNRLFQEKMMPEHYDEKLFFPIHTGDDTTLVLEPATKCTYCDAQWLKELTDEDDDDEEEILYVHADVPSRVAEGLGVKSLKTQLMSDAIGLEEWGQSEPLTTRLHNIVKEGYQDGLAVPKEIIQNADDARATTVILIYDERENADSRTQLLDEGMASCQGPALWAYNDGLFSDDDLKNITKLSGAKKESDTTKIGKFGLGFCAVYNLTDVPSFVSGQNMVIFDPHTTHLNKALPGESPGLRIDLKNMKNKRLMKKMHNQFKPFQNVLGCDLYQKDPYFNGTLFRLPLRTKQQATVSEIKSSSYSRKEMIKLLKQLVETSGNLLLFTQNVSELKLYHIPQSGVSPDSANLICTVTREIASQKFDRTILDICSDMKIKKALHLNPFETVQRVCIRIQNTKHMRIVSNAGESVFETNWLVSWATGVSKSLQLSCSTNVPGALPLGSVAVLVKSENGCVIPESMRNCTFGFYKDGHLFCYLPLPIQSNVEFHVNGSFAVTSTRRGLQTNTEDDKYSYNTQWNEALLSDTIARSFINLLVCLQQLKTTDDYKFHQLWPTSTASLTEPLRRGFYDSIVLSNHAVFESYGRWLGINQCIFLNRNMSQDLDIEESALSTLQRFRLDENKGVVKVPLIYMNELEKTKGWNEKANVVSDEEFFTKYFLPNISETYWHESDHNVSCRNKLLLYCLSHTTPNISTLLRKSDCIPTDPGDKLRKPSDLVHPKGRAAILFEIGDGRFPERNFRKNSIARKLLDLGMMKDTLTSEIVIDRATSVQSLALLGFLSQALQRCHHLIEYLTSSRNVDQPTLKQLGCISFLPVLKKPTHWPFAWHADILFEGKNNDRKICFEKASCLFLDDCQKLVGCTKLILDSSRFPYSYNRQLLIQMGINAVSNVKLESTVEQLLVISKTKDKKKDFAEKRVEEAVVEKLYEYMNKCATDDIGTFQREIKPLENRNIILFESELIPVSKVAFSIGFNCIPELYEIGRNKLSKYKHFLRGVGVKEHVQVQDVVGILQRKRLQFDANSLPPNELQLILQLLELLSVLMHNVHLRYQDIRHLGQDNIVAPDTDVILRPTTMLCLDDMNFKEASKSMRFVHSSISRTVAESIGITTKKRKFLQDCSKGIPFEQKEELVTRLKGLLDGYPCDIGVMKELIQNADDANASEIHFIKDFRTHGCNKVFDKSFKEFQGPALLVFDDSGFSKANLEGLQKLGVGSKKVDQAKTGQYGVGFNAVYNLTDLPSFITKGPEIEEGETLCILDPLQKLNDEYCGMRYNLKEIRKAFPDVIAGYSESLFNGKSKGSMFRFPLRRKKTDLGSRVSTKTINTILNTLKTEMAELLLFLRSVSKISVSDISSGTLRTEFSVHVELSEHDLAQRSYFSRCCQDKAKEISRCCQDKAKETGKTEHFKALSPPMQVTYKLHAKDSAMKEQAFVIVQRLGIDENRITPKVKDAIQMGMLGTLPIGGVAVPVLKKDEYLSKISDYMQNLLNRDLAVQRQGNYKIYCFLPLPMASGLPMHINGHFVLDHEARRSLWMEEEGYKSEWNSLILDDIVARSYIGALQCLKSEIFDSSSRGVTKDKFVGFVSLFAKYFPISKKANSKYEKRLIQSIFETIINDRVELFPVGIPDQIAREQEPTHYRIDWSSYLPEGHQFPIYCASIRSSDSYPLEDLLKTLGLKITLLTKEVNGSMKDSGFSVSCLTPNVVMKFLISFTSESIDRLQIGQLPSPVVETKFVNAGNVERLLSYCSKEPTFKNELNGLPLLVTNDGILQCFDRNKMIYCTTFCDLWPNSSAKFVHIDLVTQVCSLDIGVCNGVKANVSVNEVDELLAAEIDREVYNRDDMADLHNISSMCGYKWIRSLWNMLTDGFHDANTNEHKVDFLTYLQPLQHWCLVPAITYNKRHVLVKVNKVDTVISSGHFERSPMLKRALKKLQLPELNSVCLSEEATKQISTCVASIENPVALLICLKYYKANFTLTRLTRKDCTEISKYFSSSLADMKMNNRAEAWWIRESLKSLPIFLTLAGTSVSIENDETNVLVLPESMPSDGIREWADQTNRILLQGSVFLEQLYMFLEFKFTNSIYIYINHLLPTWQHLPVNAIKRHFEYIRDMLLRTGVSKNYDDQQLRLIEVLKHTAIIPRKNELLKASVFFSPTNKVFKLFQRKEEFLPPEFSGPEWRKFFKMIGIKTEVTSEMFIAYSQQICQDGSRNITKELKRKSVAMLECLLKQSLKWKWDVCDQISKIKFIIPHTASDMHTEIHKQCTENQTLICFAGSISNRYEDLTWTSLPLLPNEADPYSYNDVYNYQVKQTLELLHIHQEPTLDSVVLHCQNVCDSLKVCLSDVTVKDRIKKLCSWVPSFMENLYRYLQSNGLSSIIKQRLYNTPIVFLPDHKTLVPAHQTIITILPDQEIWPYLVKVPITYGKFSDLFMHLGASENPGYMLYVKVLAQIKREIGDDVMENGTYMAEWLAITSAVNNLFKNINDSTWKDSLPEDTVLYLPTRGRQLVASSSVTVCDNRDKEGRLHDFEDIQYFTGFKELGLYHTLPGINYLPVQVRPKFLTQIVREEVDVSAVVEVPDSEEARKLEHFFQSTEFIEAVLRLLKHAKSRRMERLTNVEEARVSAELQSIHVQCVTGLRTYLYVKTKRIDASVQERKCFYHQRDDQWLIYFMKSSGNQQEWLRSIDEFLVRFIMDIAGSLSDNSIVIYKMLHMINSTAGLSLLLDQMNIDAYDLPQDISFSIFPPPGTYVPVELHHLLSCELTKIGVHEYKCVAFELEDELIDDTEVSDAYNPVYIYVRITKKVSQDDETSVISEMYEIDTGNELITVPLFKLYRFFRISSDVASRELVSTDEANQSVSPEKMNKEKYSIRFYLQKAWKLKEKTDRKRVIGRLLRRYHPDRNLGNEVMCNELFVYLRQCISELEGGNSLDNEDETDWQPPPKRAYPDFASSQYYSFVEQMSNRTQRQRVHIQEYYRNKQSTYGYMRYTFNFTHSKSSYKAFHDNKEAKRWYRQAKVDLRNAIDTFNTPGEPPAFNWICYMCHQASEKALKAAWFAKDANKVPRQSHDLCMIVLGLGNSNLSQCAAELTNLLGEHTKMRYPDVLSRPNIPSTVFTKQQAEGACAVARRILSSVDEEYLG